MGPKSVGCWPVTSHSDEDVDPFSAAWIIEGRVDKACRAVLSVGKEEPLVIGFILGQHSVASRMDRFQ
eukprot:7038868-Lingulodinium_polyedra.AAC.1